jgi:hypothetical protein
MKSIGVMSQIRRGHVAGRRGCVAAFRGYVAELVCKPLSTLSFSAHFCPLPFFYLISTSTTLWVSPRSELHASAREEKNVTSRDQGPRGGQRSPSRIARPYGPVGALPSPYGRRCPCASIRARGARDAGSFIAGLGLQIEGNARLAFSLGQDVSRCVRAKTTLARSRWSVAGRRPANLRCPLPCRVARATVRGQTRHRRSPEPVGGSWAANFHCGNLLKAVVISMMGAIG